MADPLLESSKETWTFVHRQYHRQAQLWVKGHSLFGQTGYEPEALADLALEKMWLQPAAAGNDSAYA